MSNYNADVFIINIIVNIKKEKEYLSNSCFKVE